RNDGMARTSRKTATSTTATTMVEPAAVATDLNSRSPRPSARGVVFFRAPVSRVSFFALVARTRPTTTSDHEMALTAVDNFGWKESGIGMYPLSVKPL